MSKSPSSLANLLSGSWESIDQRRVKFGLFIGFFIVAYSLELLIPWAIGFTVGVFVEHGFSTTAYQLATKGILAYLALRIATTVLHHLGRYLQLEVAYSARMKMLDRLFAAVLNYKLSWHVSSHSGENLSKLSRSALAVHNMVGQHSWHVVEGLVKTVIACVGLFAVDLIVAANVVVMSAITVFTMIYFNKLMAQSLRRNKEFENKINRICVDYLSNVVTVKTLRLENHARSYLNSQEGEGRECIKKIAKFSELKWGSIGIGYAFVIASSLVIYFYHRGQTSVALNVAEVYVLINYLDKIFHAINSFAAYYGGIFEACTNYEDATTLVRGGESTLSHESAPASAWQELAIRGVSYSYGGDRACLSDVSLPLHAGEKIAIIGPSGGGKSTLLKALAGMIDAQGSIVTDRGEELPLHSLGSQALLIPQDPQIFSESLHFNLTLGEEFADDELVDALEVCRARALLEKLPQGWQTVLAENGANLSGGEKQRVAIARGMLRLGSRDLVLLDEPTASLDPKTERDIYAAIFGRFPEKTIISSCHRLHLLPLFDTVVLIEDGRVKECCSSEEFINRRIPHIGPAPVEQAVMPEAVAARA